MEKSDNSEMEIIPEGTAGQGVISTGTETSNK